MIKVDRPQKQIDRWRPFCRPSWLSFVGLNLYSNLNKILMEAVLTLYSVIAGYEVNKYVIKGAFEEIKQIGMYHNILQAVRFTGHFNIRFDYYL